jgi:hypothetical protein
MNIRTLKTRMRDNYGLVLNKMTDAERAWAEDFERMEYAIERGKVKDAEQIAQTLKGGTLSDAFVNALREDAAAKQRCNPETAESMNKASAKQRKTTQRRTSNMYDASDWIRQQFKIDPKTDKVYEVALTLNPEDALIEALDAARSHNVSLDEFINNPKYHTPEPEKKAGRPKKVEIVK